jgi:putative redox protein
MKQKRIKIENQEGLELAAYLRLPDDENIATLAIFAHCFTCTKNLNAIKNISQSLTSHKIGVLSFDFTGLGESEGEFAETNFSSNVWDLVAVAEFLTTNYQAPELLIGHSLGGAAVIQAASRIESVKAVATIGAPADAKHVSHLFQPELDQIEKEGEAQVSIGGRPFTIKKQFLDDLDKNPAEKQLKSLNQALLIMHSPQDNIVSIDNAATMYHRARHPKSFITLDGADHLLSDTKDSIYAGNMIASWATRYITFKQPSLPESESQVLTTTGDSGYLTEILAGEHYLMADEPKTLGGTDRGPTPYDLLLASLGACTGITLRMYADRKKWPLEEIKVHMSHEKRHLDDCEHCDHATSKIDHIEKTIELTGDLEDSQRARLLEISKKCPVHKSLLSEIVINSHLK